MIVETCSRCKKGTYKKERYNKNFWKISCDTCRYHEFRFTTSEESHGKTKYDNKITRNKIG